jgi:hypothetical protein
MDDFQAYLAPLCLAGLMSFETVDCIREGTVRLRGVIGWIEYLRYPGQSQLCRDILSTWRCLWISFLTNEAKGRSSLLSLLIKVGKCMLLKLDGLIVLNSQSRRCVMMTVLV